MIAYDLSKVLPKFALFVSALVLSACAENVSTIKVDTSGLSEIKMAAPAFLSSRAVVVDNLDPVVTINNERVEMVRAGDLWSGTMQVPENSNVNLKVEWFEAYSSQPLLLARAEASETDLKRDLSFTLSSTDYTTEGTDFDADGDLISNIAERQQDTNPLVAESQVITYEVESTVMIPTALDSSALDVENLNLEVSVNNRAVVMDRAGDLWSGTIQIPENSNVNLKVEWFESFNSGNLLLARAEESEASLNNDISFTVNSDDYITEGTDFDADGDLISNVDERVQGTDPLDASSPGEVEPMVKIPASLKDNDIDAQFNTAFWNNAQFLDTSSPEPQTLFIDNIIVDEVGNTVEGSPNYQWAGIHDGEFLTLFVFGKEINPSIGVSANRDSDVLLFNDDTLELFWDGNLSRANDYDSEDDMHIIIPLLRGTGSSMIANKSGEPDTVVERGPNMNSSVIFDVDDIGAIEFAACLCQGERTTWEIRINLEKAQIPVGKTFGFEIQIGQDDDGGDRDSKWAWALPERKPTDNNSESDLTWRFPSTMGLMKLLAFPGQ